MPSWKDASLHGWRIRVDAILPLGMFPRSEEWQRVMPGTRLARNESVDPPKTHLQRGWSINAIGIISTDLKRLHLVVPQYAWGAEGSGRPFGATEFATGLRRSLGGPCLKRPLPHGVTFFTPSVALLGSPIRAIPKKHARSHRLVLISSVLAKVATQTL